MEMRNKIVLYRDFQDNYRWRLRAPTGETLAASPSGHHDKAACEAEIGAFMAEHPNTQLRDAAPAMAS